MKSIAFIDNDVENDLHILGDPIDPHLLLSNSSCQGNPVSYYTLSSPEHVLKNIKHQTITLLDAWNNLGLQKKVIFRCFKGNSSNPDNKYCTINEIHNLLSYYNTIYWVPHTFKTIKPASILNLVKLHAIVADLDSKCCTRFWIILEELFTIWGAGGTVDGIPKPSLVVFSGNGVHLYWTIPDKVMGDRRKELAKLTQKVFLYILGKRFNSRFDRISIIQALRIPESYTKSGSLCTVYKIDDVEEIKFLRLLTSCLNDEQIRIVDDYLFGNATNEDLEDLYKNIIADPNDCDPIERTKELTNKINKDLDLFDNNTIGFIGKIIDDSDIIKKDFAKKLIYIIKGQSLISTGYRDNRLFGLSVGLAKCGADQETIKTLVRICNHNFLETPLTSSQLYCCYKNATQYLQMGQERLMSFLGIGWWPSFYKRESKMTRTEAAVNAANIQKDRSISKLKNALIKIGNTYNVSELCEVAGIGRKTYYRLKNAGIVDQVMCEIKI